MERTCKKCENIFLSSELIGGMFCFPCTKKALSGTRKIAKVLRVFSSFYRYTPIIAVAISLTLILLELSWVIITLPVIFLFVCLLGAFPHMHTPLTVENIKDVEQNYKEQLNNYTPSGVTYCINHLTREAISRCGICIEPFCAECFYFQQIRIPRPPFRSIKYEQPAYCLKCGNQFKAGISVSPILYTILTVGALLVINFLFVEHSEGVFFILLPAFICIIALPLGLLSLKSKLYTKEPTFERSEEFGYEYS